MTEFERFDQALAKFEQDFTDESPIKYSSCKHSNISDEKGVITCTDCGQEIERSTDDQEWRWHGSSSDGKRGQDPNRVQRRKIEDKSIFKDVEGMGFSDKIVTLGNKIYCDATQGSIFRGNTRKSIVFASIFHAYKLDGHPQDHVVLLDVFSLKRKVALTGLNIVNRNSPKDAAFRSVDITPEHLINDIMDQFGATIQQKKQVKKLYNLLIDTSTKLKGSRPNSVACSLVYYYILIKKMNITIKQFANKVRLSDLTIQKLAKEISLIFNTPEIL